MAYALKIGEAEFKPLTSFWVAVPWMLDQTNVVRFHDAGANQFPSLCAVLLSAPSPAKTPGAKPGSLITQPPIPIVGGGDLKINNYGNAGSFTLAGATHANWSTGLYANESEVLHLFQAQPGKLSFTGWKCSVDERWEKKINADNTIHHSFVVTFNKAERVCYSPRFFGNANGVTTAAFQMPLLDGSVFAELQASDNNNVAFPKFEIAINETANPIKLRKNARGWYVIAQGVFKQAGWSQFLKWHSKLSAARGALDPLFADLCEVASFPGAFSRTIENCDVTEENSVYQNRDVPVEILFLETADATTITY